MRRWPNLDREAIRVSNRKQAMIPEGATVIDPVGTAPGLVVPPREGTRPTVVVLPGPPRELQPMWETAKSTDAFKAAIAGATTYERGILRLFGIPESEIANTLRAAEADGLELEPLEITTCLRRGEIEVSTRYEPSGAAALRGARRFHPRSPPRHAVLRGRLDRRRAGRRAARRPQGRGRRVGDGRADGRAPDRASRLLPVLRGWGRRVFERGEGGAGRRGRGADRAARGGLGGGRGGARRGRLSSGSSADFGIGITGIAGPDGGTEEKPVGTVSFSVLERGGERITRSTRLPGGRADVRDRSTTVAMHLLRRLLVGEAGGSLPGGAPASAPTAR